MNPISNVQQVVGFVTEALLYAYTFVICFFQQVLLNHLGLFAGPDIGRHKLRLFHTERSLKIMFNETTGFKPVSMRLLHSVL